MLGRNSHVVVAGESNAADTAVQLAPYPARRNQAVCLMRPHREPCKANLAHVDFMQQLIDAFLFAPRVFHPANEVAHDVAIGRFRVVAHFLNHHVNLIQVLCLIFGV